MNQHENEYIPPEDEAFIKIYGIVEDATCKLEHVVVVPQDIGVDMIDVNVDGMMYYLYGFTEDYNDGTLRTFIDYVTAYRGDEFLAMRFLEELVAGGINFYFTHNHVVNFAEGFSLRLAMTNEENQKTYNKLIEVVEKSWIDAIMYDLFVIGINLGMNRPEHESYLHNLN